jgi:hypothetical protein
MLATISGLAGFVMSITCTTGSDVRDLRVSSRRREPDALAGRFGSRAASGRRIASRVYPCQLETGGESIAPKLIVER